MNLTEGPDSETCFPSSTDQAVHGAVSKMSELRRLTAPMPIMPSLAQDATAVR